MSIDELPTRLYRAFSELGKALSNEHRLRMLNLLMQRAMSVDELAEQIEQSTANTSAHLKVLHTARLVTRRREGKRVFYEIASSEAANLWLALRETGLKQLPGVRALMRQYASDPSSLSLLDSRELLDKITRREVILLDLRPKAEYDVGHLPHARSVPLTELRTRLGELPRDKQIVAYCRGPFCVGAIESVQLLRDNDFDAHMLHESVTEWRAADWPLESVEEAMQ